MSADAHALCACCCAAMAATNGHHRRWAKARCVAALLSHGATPASEANAARAANAMLTLAEVINKRAASWASAADQAAA